MQVSTKPKMELRSKLIRIAAAAGLALAIGRFGLGTAGGRRPPRGGAKCGGPPAAAAVVATGEAMVVITTRLSRITTQRLSHTPMAMRPDTKQRRRRASASSLDFRSRDPLAGSVLT